MTDEQIIKMAKQAGLGRETPDDHFVAVWSANPTTLQAFAQLVRNAALEEAALVCDGNADRALTLTGAARADACAYKIRSMKK